jgi:hypothetical protein
LQGSSLAQPPFARSAAQRSSGSVVHADVPRQSRPQRRSNDLDACQDHGTRLPLLLLRVNKRLCLSRSGVNIRVRDLRTAKFSGRYWARTSDPQLVDSEQRSHPFVSVRGIRVLSEISTEANGPASASERQSLPSLPRNGRRHAAAMSRAEEAETTMDSTARACAIGQRGRRVCRRVLLETRRRR